MQTNTQLQLARTVALPALSALAVSFVLMATAGCGKQTPAESSSSAPPQTSAPAAQPPNKKANSAPVARPQTPVATPQAKASAAVSQTPSVMTDPALQDLEKHSGLALSAGTQAFTHSDGGVADPSIGYYEWVISSPTQLPLPAGGRSGEVPVSNLPLEEAVKFVEGKMKGGKIQNAQSAFSTGWQQNGFAFSGTWVRTLDGDYVVVQQTRQ